MKETERNDLQVTITQVLQEMKEEAGENFSLEKVSVAEFVRRTSLSRK